MSKVSKWSAKSSVGFALTAVLLLGCGGCGDKDQRPKPPKSQSLSRSILLEPKNDSYFQVGDSLRLVLKTRKEGDKWDSVRVYLNGEHQITAFTNEALVVSLEGLKTGRNQLGTEQYFSGEKEKNLRVINLRSDLVPEKFGLEVKKVYEHDSQDFTQGLVYDNGIVYEGTGRRGQSKLIKRQGIGGPIIHQREVQDNLFGEGIALYGEKIYQLTYKKRRGFIYRADDLELESDFSFNTETGEGWGLCTMGEELVASDGSHKLYFWDPNTLETIRTIEVYNHMNKVSHLNELEYAKGRIYANVYGEDFIVEIDPENGKVTGIIDCRSLKSQVENIPGKEDVLNGIAFNSENGRFLLTGKLWPKLFEVEFVKL